MVNNGQRLELAREWIKTLFDIHQKTNFIKEQIEDKSVLIMEKAYNEKLSELIELQSQFETNEREGQNLNSEALKAINTWHEWANNLGNKRRLLYPLRHYFGKRKLKRQLLQINKQNIQRTIKNRLIKEKAASWEIEVSRMAEKCLKDNEEYREFMEILTKKKNLIGDLKYLLSSIPEICPVEIDLADMKSAEAIFFKAATTL